MVGNFSSLKNRISSLPFPFFFTFLPSFGFAPSVSYLIFDQTFSCRRRRRHLCHLYGSCRFCRHRCRRCRRRRRRRRCRLRPSPRRLKH